MLVRVTDYQERGPSEVHPRTVYIQTGYIVAMEAQGARFRVFVGRSLEYVVSPEDAERLGQAGESEAVA